MNTSNNLEDLIHKDLQEKYNELFSIEKFFYAIWHFLEEYVICPILGDAEIDTGVVGEDSDASH